MQIQLMDVKLIQTLITIIVEIVQLFVLEQNNVYLDLVLSIHVQEEVQIVISMEVVKQISTMM